MNTINIKSELLEKMYDEFMEEEVLSIKGFEGWNFYLDEDDCEFDLNHGAKVDYALYLYTPDGVEYSGRGGYKTEITGLRFDNDVKFTEVSKTLPVKNNKVRFDINLSVDFTLDESFKDKEINKEYLEKIFNSYLKDNLKDVKVIGINYEF